MRCVYQIYLTVEHDAALYVPIYVYTVCIYIQRKYTFGIYVHTMRCSAAAKRTVRCTRFTHIYVQQTENIVRILLLHFVLFQTTYTHPVSRLYRATYPRRFYLKAINL